LNFNFIFIDLPSTYNVIVIFIVII